MMHGFALNVSTDLRAFDLIVPCGIPDCRMTSMEELTGERISCDSVCDPLARHLAEIWDLEAKLEESHGWPI
jgi:lipoyl(octanoyl) transferase